ncbi:MAG: FecR domain-containing protein [Chitinophagaceae bacterium]|nr:FecR domain-containing protein [Chitinophagaceae bacterium]MCW5925746.1 FecR domain-containing protein [Chitinophagaceae bacterium]
MSASRIQYLLQQYENNNCSREEMEELFYYIRTNKEANSSLRSWVNQNYQKIRKHNPSFAYVNESGQLVTESIHTNHEEKPFDGRRSTLSIPLTLLVGLSVIGVLLWLGSKKINRETKIAGREKNQVVQSTGKGENKYLLLPDSSQVWMNVASTLHYYDDFSEDRKVKITGEAFFKVKHNTQPFTIKTNNIVLKTQNASCNLKAYENENETIVSVSQGKVTVHKNGDRINELTPGRQLNIGKSDKSVMEKSIAVEKISAWQWGEYIYDYAELKDIILGLERIFNVKIVLLDQDKKNQKVYISFRREMGIEECLTRLGKLTSMELNHVGDEYLLGSSAPGS